MNKKITFLLIQFIYLISFSQTTTLTNSTSTTSNSYQGVPFRTYDGSKRYSASESIYKYGELTTTGTAAGTKYFGTISEIGYTSLTSANRNNTSVKIYLKTTTATTVSGSIDLNSYTLVYNGSASGFFSTSTGSPRYIALATPFAWYQDNLSVLIVFEDNSSSGAGFYFSSDAKTNESRIYSGTTAWTASSSMTAATRKAKINLKITDPSQLPIELISFTAEENRHKVDLKWITASERNNHFFTIYRSSDLENWEELVKIKGKGNSSKESSYSFTDKQPFYGTNYYKLKQTDFDGRYEEFSPVSILIGSRNSVSVFPNPAKDILFIHTDNLENQQMILQISDCSGKMVYSSSGEQKSIDISGLNAGIYFISVDINGNVERHKIEIR